MSDPSRTPEPIQDNGGSELPADENVKASAFAGASTNRPNSQSTGAPTIPTPAAFEEMGDINGALKNVLLLQAQYARGAGGITRQMRDVACESLAHEIKRYVEATRSLASEMPYRQDAERYRLFRAACGTRDRMVGFCIREWFYTGTCAESTLDEALDKALANASPDK